MARHPGITVSVIVPAFNAEDTLPECIDALLHQTVARDEYEVIVVDDGSTDGTAQVAQRSGVIRILQPHRGPGAARNAGIQWARGDLLLFTDADCVPAPNWIEAMALPFVNPEVAGCKGIYRTHQRNLIARFVQVEYEEKYRAMEGTTSIDFVDTYSAAYRKRVLMHEGCFSEEILAAEDAELSFRLAQRGYRLVFNPQGFVYHRHSQSIGHYVRRKFRYGTWRVHVYHRYPEKLKGDSHTPGNLRWQLGLTALMLLSLPLSLFVLPWVGWILLVSVAAFLATTVPFVVRTARRDPAAALIAPFMLWLRALALGLGLSCGLVLRGTRRFSKKAGLEKHVP